jgi:hypothetical protein
MKKKRDNELEVKQKQIVKLVKQVGEDAPYYTGGESVDNLRAYFRLFLEPLLRQLKERGIIKDFMIGISEVWFFFPKLKIYINGQENFIMELHPYFKIGRISRA